MNRDSSKKRSIAFLINKIKDKKTDLDVQIPKTAFFLGAGCSKSSEIPLGGEIIEMLRQLWFIENFSEKSTWIKNDFEIDGTFLIKNKNNFEQETFKKELELKNEIQNSNKDLTEVQLNNIFSDQLYGFWFNKFSEDPRERQRLIEFLIDKATPSGAYILLSILIENNVVKNIFTTNFDDLINQALIQYTETKARVYSHNEIARFINIYSCKPNIIKLHGDYLFENIKNTIPETNALVENMESKFREALTSQDLMVIGYNGADLSVIDILRKIKENTKYGLYWCADNYNNINWKVRSLIEETENSYFIEIENFEYFIYKLYESFENIIIPDIRQLYDKKQIELTNYLRKFSNDLQKSDKIDSVQKEKIIDKLNIILNDNSFKEVYDLDFEKRLEYLRKLRVDGISRIIKNICSHYSKSEANELFENLDDGNFFQSKLKEVSIVHISNALTNLKEVDRNRTFRILDSIDSDILLKKITEAEENELFSAFGELGNIAPDKITKIKNQLKPQGNFDFKNKSIRELNYFLSNIAESEAIKFIRLNKEEVVQKVSSESAKELTLFFENLLKINKNACILIFDELPNLDIAKRIEREEIHQIGLASHTFSRINKSKTFDVFTNLDERLLVKKALKVSFNNLQVGIFNISLSNEFLAFKIVDNITDSDLLGKVSDSQIIEIAEGLSNLCDINPERIKNAFISIDDDLLAQKLSDSDFTFQQYGSTINKLAKLDFKKTVKIARKVDFKKLSSKMIKTINRTGPQVFLHYLPIVSKVDNRIIDIYTNPANKEFIASLLTWERFELYTINLKFLSESLLRHGMTNEAKYVDEVIKKNSFRLFKKLNKKHLP